MSSWTLFLFGLLVPRIILVDCEDLAVAGVDFDLGDFFVRADDFEGIHQIPVFDFEFSFDDASGRSSERGGECLLEGDLCQRWQVSGFDFALWTN